MILQALAAYYDRLASDPNSRIAPPGFEWKEIPFLVEIRSDGSFIGFRDTRTGEGKKKVARSFLVPQGEKKTVGLKANILWDNPEYLFAEPKSESEKDAKRAVKAHAQFRQRLEDLVPADNRDPKISAVLAFLQGIEFDKVRADAHWGEVAETRANSTFVLDGDTELVAQCPAVRELLEDSLAERAGDSRTCAVSGEEDVPAVLHTAIKGVWGAQTSGANIVSFNLDASESYGKKKGLNAPVGKRAEFAYTTALNHLLAKGSPQRMQIGDASTVFWAAKEHPVEADFSCFLTDPPIGEEAASYGRIRALLSAVRTGVLPEEDDMPFYVLGLAPNAARIAVRFWYESTVKELKQRIASHFEDIEIVRAPHDPEFLSLFRLLCSVAVAGKADNVPPNMGGELVRAVLSGAPYSRALLAGAVMRCKAEQRVTHARAALIKAVLVRASRYNQSTTKEVAMGLDRSNDNLGYTLGRLFAVLERVQETTAEGRKLNKTIRDTYFGAACSSPLATFTQLQKLAIHHLAKIRNSGKSTVWLDQQLQEVMGHVPASGVPSILTMDDQGRFAVGYYHQRQDFFTKKDAEEEGDEV